MNTTISTHLVHSLQSITLKMLRICKKVLNNVKYKRVQKFYSRKHAFQEM